MSRWLGKIFARQSGGAPPSGYYVATTGGTGAGTFGDPWSLAYGLGGGGGAVQPGDTIWLRGGTYTGSFTSTLTGTNGSRIVVRPYPGERPVIDGNGASGSNILEIGGGYTRYQGLEVVDYNYIENWAAGGIGCASGEFFGIEIVNCIVHDVGGGGITPFSQWNGSMVYGNVIYYCGGSKFTGDNHAYPIYMQNSTNNGDNVIENNIVGLSWGRWSLHAYTQADDLAHICWRKNAVLTGLMPYTSGPNMRLLIGGTPVVTDFECMDNLFYTAYDVTAPVMDLGGQIYNGMNGATITGNYFGCGANEIYGTNITCTGNTFAGTGQGWTYGAGGTYPTNTFDTIPPTANWVMVHPNTYESGRGHLYCINWSDAGSQDFDLSSILSVNDTYEILDASNYFGTPLKTGTYAGGSVSVTLPASPTVATPNVTPSDRTVPTHPKPFFALVVRKT